MYYKTEEYKLEQWFVFAKFSCLTCIVMINAAFKVHLRNNCFSRVSMNDNVLLVMMENDG
jgi:hypothetical protein